MPSLVAAAMQAEPPVHWTTYASFVVALLSMVGTFVYVYFTYHIMKWAIGQGKAALALTNSQLEQHRSQMLWRFDAVRQLLMQLPQQRVGDPLPTPGNVGAFLVTWNNVLNKLESFIARGELPVEFKIESDQAASLVSQGTRLDHACRAKVGWGDTATTEDLREKLVRLTESRETLIRMCTDGQFALIQSHS